MPLDYSIEADGGLLTVTTKGFDDNIDEAVKYGEDIIRQCFEKNCRMILVDESQVAAVLDPVSQYEMVQRLKSLIPYELSIALLANIDHYQDTSFGGMVAENRGINVKVFTSAQDALAWLRLCQPQ